MIDAQPFQEKVHTRFDFRVPNIVAQAIITDADD